MVRKSVKVAMDAKTETRPVAMLVQVAASLKAGFMLKVVLKK